MHFKNFPLAEQSARENAEEMPPAVKVGKYCLISCSAPNIHNVLQQAQHNDDHGDEGQISENAHRECQTEKRKQQT